MDEKYPIISRGGRPFSIDLTNCPERPTITQADEVMEALSAAYGFRMGAIKSGGYWILGDTTNGWSPIYGHRSGEQTRKFDLMLTRGLEIAVTRRVPM